MDASIRTGDKLKIIKDYILNSWELEGSRIQIFKRLFEFMKK